ncbi:uncharacterized protein TNCV_3836161 [Trichonephila clavipes]|nr:uncharacterized protein TNCV_3836161 [Trichonephila clavipes]
MDEILTNARDLDLEVNEDDIEEIMGHEDELTIEELQETERNASPSEQEEDERGPIPTSAIKDLLKKWEAVRAMVLEWHPNQASVSRVGDLYNDNAINYFRKILKKREKQSTLDMFYTPHKQNMKRTGYFARLYMTATAGSDIVQSGRPIFDDFFQHLWPYIGNNTANVVFQMVKRLWLIRIDQ